MRDFDEPVGVLEALPVAVSMRRSAENDFGGPLDLWTDVPRWDGGGFSREAAHPCRKDWRANDVHKHDRRRTRRAVRALKESTLYGTL